VNGLQLFLLGRKLMKMGEESIVRSGFSDIPASVRSILIDVIEHQPSTIGAIVARTGFPQSHVSTAVAKLRDGGALITETDPEDRRRTLVKPSPRIPQVAAKLAAVTVDEVLAENIGSGSVDEARDHLELLAQLLSRPETSGTAGRPGPGGPADFDEMYAGTPPWDIGRPQPELLELAHQGAFRGHVLDVGCGTGEHALLAAQLGLEATGIDSAPRAIEIARSKARERGLKARFEVWDALELDKLGSEFDTVVDSGLFHVFDDEQRVRFVRSLSPVMLPGSRYLLLCFSEDAPGTFGPRRIAQEEIRSSFTGGWKVESIDRAKMAVTFSPDGMPAWRATIARIQGPGGRANGS
jgi:SAM-dependent methyltransferase/DNA-binding MarR family transcriptional regulator